MKAQQSVQNSFESRTTISSSSNTLVVPNNNMSSSTSVVANTNSLEELVLKIVRYVRHLNTNIEAIPIPIHVYQLVELMMKR
ncbi:unnamed protein product [Rotaria sordida]|uniref:Uncharacterized protein n=1 Tax=Rotaria sordida TaxID=392033 RepID=A0A816CSY9_9BILA|nr:unnamed protein product [Rotaria sordida]CAF1625045.1 unnamed protein product [Rotaria sordida]